MHICIKKLFLLFCCISISPLLTSQFLQPEFLECEYLNNPLCVDVSQPRFTWKFTSSQKNKMQSAYEIIVSDNTKDIYKLKGNEWTSGKIISNENVNVEYEGKAIQPFTRYYWRVKVYDEDRNPYNWSKPSWFETALLNINDCSAKWINYVSKNPANDSDYYKQDRMSLFRKEFFATKKIQSARLYISGVGYYEAYLNGEKVGDHVLDPGFNTYRKEVLYSVYNITSLLTRGNNVVEIMLGNGWWNPLPLKLFGRWDLRDYQQTGTPCVTSEIHIKYADGSSGKIITDENWLTAPGPVTHNNVYLGEKYDARLEKKKWNIAGADKSLWKHAVVTDDRSGTMTAQMQPPIRITKVIKPVKITEAGKDTFIVDMGQNFAGVAQIKIRGEAGRKISLRYGEALFKNESLNYQGKGTEIWNPRFTFHGFRYIEITGWPGKPVEENISGLRMNSDVQQAGSFVCSNEQLNKLHEAIQWTFLSNIFSVQSDCPGREKMGYGADMVVTANAFMYNYDMAQFDSKTVKDFANEQRPEGGITEIAPFTGIDDRGYRDESGPIGWELAFPYLQKQLYEFYGYKRIIENNYNAIVKQINFLQSKTVSGLLYWGISDHEALDPKPEAFTSAAFYYHHLKLAEEFAGMLNKKQDSIKYGRMANQVKNAIVSKFLVPGTGHFDNATQSVQIIALWYGFSTEKDLRWKVLMDEFSRHNWHLATGIFSTKMMFDVFRGNNANDTAYKIATQPNYPGWLNMINHNATTFWETWAYPESFPSQNHPMFGSIDEWFYRSLLGINCAESGFGKNKEAIIHYT